MPVVPNELSFHIATKGTFDYIEVTNSCAMPVESVNNPRIVWFEQFKSSFVFKISSRVVWLKDLSDTAEPWGSVLTQWFPG